jgi:hypothetical protein
VSQEQTTTENKWFYEENGCRKGPISEGEMIQFIKSSVISHGTSVWKQGFQDWSKIENTDLHIHLNNSTPPPLSGEKINNTLAWVLALAPLIGYFIEWFIAGAMHGGNTFAAQVAMANSQYWYITLGLNISIAFFDEKRLKDAGHNTDEFKGWVWIVPVYLYQRAQATKQNLAYFIVWLACFILVLLS